MSRSNSVDNSMTQADGFLMRSRARRICDVALTVLLWPGVAAAEVVDQSVTVPMGAQLTQLAETRGLVPVENRNAE